MGGKIGIAGFRIDAAKHQDAGELGELLSRVNKSLYLFQEVIAGDGEAVTPQMYTSLGQVTEFNYARKLAPNFADEGKLKYLSSFGEGWGMLKSSDAVVFFDNHDSQRGGADLTYKNGEVYQLGNIFMLAHPYGYPKVMSSYYFDQHDQGPPSSSVHSGSSVNCGSPTGTNGKPWVCEHRWTAIANMVAWRKSAGSSDVTGFAAPDGNTISFCRGSAACVALNRGSNTWSTSVKFSVPAGEYCNVIVSDDTSSCPSIVVNSDGSANVQVPAVGAVAVHIGKKKGPSPAPGPSPGPAPSPAPVDRCNIADESKVDCGQVGTQQSDCEAQGCCWKPADSDGTPWCYHPLPSQVIV